MLRGYVYNVPHAFAETGFDFGCRGPLQAAYGDLEDFE